MDFCKELYAFHSTLGNYHEPRLTISNARTAHLAPSVPTPTAITINPDRTFSFSIRTPPVSYLLKKAAGIDKGAGSGKSGSVTLKHIYEIAKVKCQDEALGVLGEERVARAVVGSARSLGLEVVP
jgi:large subunit ribosomal protein L11